MAGNVNFSFRRQASHTIHPSLHGVTSIGRPGLPSSMQRFINYKLRPRGVGDINSDETAIAQSPFVTPAFLAAQAALLQNACAVGDPYVCAAAQATGDITTGGNPSSDAVLSLTQYCQNIQGFQTDPQCSNGAPTAAAVQAASAVTYTPAQIAAQNLYAQQTGIVTGSANISSAGGSGTQGGGPVLTATAQPAPPPAPPTTQVMPTVQNSNTVGTSGSASGSLLNGQPVSGAATPTTTDYTPYLMAAAIAVVLILVSK
jgi:hypothetical protein